MNTKPSIKQSILITGIAGSGKSTLCTKLIERGYEAYGIEDVEGMFAMYRIGTKELFTDFDNADPEKINNSEWLCNIEKLESLIASQTSNLAFYCGVGSNMEEIIPLFDRVFLLKANAAAIHRRLSNREGTDDMGNTEESRQAVLGWKDWWENDMVEKGAIIIDAQGEPDAVIKKLLEKL